MSDGPNLSISKRKNSPGWRARGRLVEHLRKKYSLFPFIRELGDVNSQLRMEIKIYISKRRTGRPSWDKFNHGTSTDSRRPKDECIKMIVT